MLFTLTRDQWLKRLSFSSVLLKFLNFLSCRQPVKILFFWRVFFIFVFQGKKFVFIWFLFHHRISLKPKEFYHLSSDELPFRKKSTKKKKKYSMPLFLFKLLVLEETQVLLIVITMFYFNTVQISEKKKKS